jgi:riboflavin synthase
MFTGLIESIGTLESAGRTASGIELRVSCGWDDIVDGESISINGVCLTVLSQAPRAFAVAAMSETIGRTSIGDWTPGRKLNLERALRAGDRLGGHIVQGHVDGVGTVISATRQPDSVLLDVSLPRGLSETLVLHGSVALDGVSLTVNRLESDNLQVALIDYTLGHTALGDLREGDRVNVETDVIGKHVRHLMGPYLNR